MDRYYLDELKEQIYFTLTSLGTLQKGTKEYTKLARELIKLHEEVNKHEQKIMKN